jgi:hypothetical protein
MTAEVAADRPPDPIPSGTSGDDPVMPSPNHAGDESISPQRPGQTARARGRTLISCRVAALPVLDRFLRRLRLAEFLRDHLPCEDRRSRVPTATALLVLLKNLLIAREPLYGIGEWAARHAPEPLGLTPGQSPALNDDRVGRCLDRLFDADIPSLTLAAVAHAVREFGVELDELHNDSTTVTLHGDYESADRERTLRGRPRLAVTWGHNKDHRPDLKQLLYIITVTRDGAVPVQFRVESGNATDDRSHRATWELLCQLTGRRDFLYVADCKLATAENMAHLHQHGGRFLTVLPRTRGEDAAFRATVSGGKTRWRAIHDRLDDDGSLTDRFSVHEPEATSAEGYRLIWYHSTRKAELDALARHNWHGTSGSSGRWRRWPSFRRSSPRRGRDTASVPRWQGSWTRSSATVKSRASSRSRSGNGRPRHSARSGAAAPGPTRGTCGGRARGST